MHLTRNQAYLHGYRGFKSPSLRHDRFGPDWRRYLEGMARDGLYSGGGNRFALASARISG